MRLEVVFRIYRRLLIVCPDLCDRVVMYADKDDPYDRMSVLAVFMPKKKRELKYNENMNLRRFCNYNGITFHFNEKGEMIWLSTDITATNGKQNYGKM